MAHVAWVPMSASGDAYLAGLTWTPEKFFPQDASGQFKLNPRIAPLLRALHGRSGSGGDAQTCGWNWPSPQGACL